MTERNNLKDINPLRIPMTDKRLRVITFKIDKTTLEILDSMARQQKVPRSVLIRKAIIDYIRKYSERLTPPPRIVRI